jgi:hypothetical protein
MTTYINTQRLLPRMQSRSLPFSNSIHQQIQQLTPCHWRLPNDLIVLRRHSQDLSTIIEPPKRDPHTLSEARDRVQTLAQTDAVKEFGGVGTDANAGADFFVLGGLFVDVDGDVEGWVGGGGEVVDEEGAGEAANAPTYYGDCEGLSHASINLIMSRFQLSARSEVGS